MVPQDCDTMTLFKNYGCPGKPYPPVKGVTETGYFFDHLICIIQGSSWVLTVGRSDYLGRSDSQIGRSECTTATFLVNLKTN